MPKVDYFAFAGGLDLTTPAIAAAPGTCLLAENYEVDIYGGYRRILGYERYDGQASPVDTGAGDPVAIEAQRALIAAVPGSGSIRGVWVYKGIVYAFRDNVGATACLMYKATAAGWVAVATPVLTAGGSYEFVNYNFTGATATAMMYGCDGINKAFQFDGTLFTQITTGMTADTPNHIAAHKKHLFLSFPGGSIQNSSIGDPLTWTPLTGASEIALGDECTGMEQQTGDALAIFTRNQTHVLYGTSVADWNLRPFSRTTGCIAGTSQRLGNMNYYLDDRGVTSLTATQAFGDFVADSISQKINPIVQGIIPKITTSMHIRDKGQYRLFTTQGQGLCATFNGNQLAGWSTIRLPNPVICAVSGEDSTGAEVIYFGSDNGFVYQMEKGTSFDGAAVPATLRMHFNHLKSPMLRKRYRRIMIDQEGTTINTPITFQASYESGAYTQGQGSSIQLALKGQKFYWNEKAWGTFTWSSDDPTYMIANVDGTAKNIGILLYSNLKYEEAYRLTGALVHFDLRRVERGD